MSEQLDHEMRRHREIKAQAVNPVGCMVWVWLTLTVMIVLGTWITTSFFEARAYNRLTGGSATTLDAMFTQLRVVGDEKDRRLR